MEPIFCNACGTTDVLDRHHIIPRGMGGSSIDSIHDQSNLITLCRTCHSKIHAGIWRIDRSTSQVKIFDALTGEQIARRPAAIFQNLDTILGAFNTLENFLVSLISSLSDLEDDLLVEAYSYATRFGKRSWLLQAAIIFETQQRSTYGASSLEGIARRFEISLRHAQKLALVWRIFFHNEDDENVNIDAYSLEEPSWYVVAATETNNPHTWLAYAQDRKAQNPQYGVTAFRRDIQMSRWMQGVGDAKDAAGQEGLSIATPSWRCPWVELLCLRSGKPVPRSECRDCDFAKGENCETKPTYLEGDDG